MSWLHRTLDHLFTEPSESRARQQGPWSDAARRQRELEIEIEARRGMRGF